MKACPFCAEPIQDDAIKCRFCGEFLTDDAVRRRPGEKNVPWYFRTTSLIVAFLCVGPLMLPLIWLHPAIGRKAKIVWTTVILAITWALGKVLAFALGNIGDYYSVLQGSYRP